LRLHFLQATAVSLVYLLGLSSALIADDTAANPAAAIAADNLQRIFSGTTPGSVSELRAMQSHVAKLTDQLAKCTVGVEVGPAQGSGVIISKDGYVLTAAHVASPPRGGRGRGPGGRAPPEVSDQEVTFYMSDGKKVTGKTLGLFRTLDAGLLKITDGGEYPYAEMGDSDSLKLGQWCLVMGHPGGYQSERGVVLRLGRVMLIDNDAITTDCTLVGGDSGGPLFDMQGRVIGINSRISEDLVSNMHVPVKTYKDTWDRLVSGEVWGRFPGSRSPYLGVQADENAKDAKIASVAAGSPAAEAGLQAGDVVLKFGGRVISNFAALKGAVEESREFRRQQTIKMQVRRGEELIDLDVMLRYRDSD
jgi:serine protease Do